MNQQPVCNSQQCTEKQPREDCRPNRCIPLEEQSCDNSGKRKHGADRKINASGGDDECHTDRQQQPERICFQNIDQISDCEKSAGAYAEEHSKQQAEADKQTQGSIPAEKAFHAVAPRSRSRMSRCSSSGDESFAMISAMQRPARITKIRSAISNT